MRPRVPLAIVVALLVLPTASLAAETSVVRVSGPSPFPLGDCRPLDEPFTGDGRGAETDPSIAINPTNPENIVAAWPQDSAYGFVAASSFDGGTSWMQTVVPRLTTCTGGSEDHMLHARLSFGGDGRLYLSGETLDGFFPDPRSGDAHIPVVTSEDGGLTWSDPVRVDDLPVLNGFDRIAAEPDVPGAAVVVWHTPEGAATSYLSRTTDGGRTWTKHELPNPHPELQPFQSVLAAPDGALYVFYADQTALATVGLIAAVGGVPLNFGTNLFVTRSDDKGVTWSSPSLVVSGVPAEWVGTAAGPEGSVYVSTWRDGADGRELVVLRSEDRGTTWSQPTVIATNVLAPFPLLAAQPDGTLGISYNQATPEGTSVHFARSDDQGSTWTTEVVAGPFAPGAFGFYQETSASREGFASIFIRGGPDTDGPTDVYVALIPDKCRGGGRLCHGPMRSH